MYTHDTCLAAKPKKLCIFKMVACTSGLIFSTMGVIVIWYIVMHGKISVVIKTAEVR